MDAPVPVNTSPNAVIPTVPDASSATQFPTIPTPQTPPAPVISPAQPISSVAGATPPSATETPPQADLQQGAQGQDVQALQNYLTQMGYLTPDQIGTGGGTYGPQTTAAVAKLQQDLGIQAGKGAGTYGPQTKQALASKYQNLFQSVKSTKAPDQSSAATAAITAASQPSTDPVFGAMASSLAPIMQSLSQVLQNINNPALTAVSLQSEYNDLAQKNNLPGMQADLLNMQRIMTGTEDDIRDEISKTGGFATESQVLGMSAARNKVILKQYNSLATQYQAAQTNVSNMMQYATTDQATQLQRQSATASVTESMASIESQMISMGQTMQQNANGNLNKIVTNVGYQGLAAQAQGNPQILSSYESILGLSPGSLSNPTSLAQLETYRQQTIAQGQQKVQIQMYNAGIGTGGIQPQIVANPGGGASVTQPYASTDLVRPTWLNANVPLSMSDAQMQQYLSSSSATMDSGTKNVVAPGIGYYLQQSDGSYVLNSAVPTKTATNSVDSQYQNMVGTMKKDQQTPVAGSPLNKGRLSRNANTALKNYVGSTVYQQVSNAVSYLARVKAAMQNPGSISDTELADAIIKINTGGGQVTEAQIGTYFQGQSYADKFAIVGDKMTAKGGVLSPQQRQDLAALAQETFTNYQTQYEQLYVQAGQNLEGQGIPLNYLANIPDFTELLNGQAATVQ